MSCPHSQLGDSHRDASVEPHILFPCRTSQICDLLLMKIDSFLLTNMQHLLCKRELATMPLNPFLLELFRIPHGLHCAPGKASHKPRWGGQSSTAILTLSSLSIIPRDTCLGLNLGKACAHHPRHPTVLTLFRLRSCCSQAYVAAGTEST